MTPEARNLLLGAAVVLILLGVSCVLNAQDREAQKNTLRLQATEFCAIVGRPPQPLADAINNAVGQDPRTWLPIMAWWNKIAARYKAAGCGDV